MSEQSQELKFPEGSENAVNTIKLANPDYGETILEGLSMVNAPLEAYKTIAHSYLDAILLTLFEDIHENITEGTGTYSLSIERLCHMKEEAGTHPGALIITSLDEMQNLLERFAQVRPFTSATTLLFCEGQLVLLVLEKDAEDRPCIPERGQLKLPGGANGGLVDPNHSWEELADAQLINWLGVSLMDLPHTGFAACEYDMNTINQPLKSPFGKLHPDLATIENKRQSHVFVAHITPEQLDTCVLGSGVQDILLVDSYDELVALQDAGRISFPHEMPAIEAAWGDRGFHNLVEVKEWEGCNWAI